MPILAETRESRSERDHLDERVVDALGQRGRTGVVVGRGGNDRELVAAEPGDHVVLPNARREALRDHREQLVAGGVAQAVVDRLEVVEVDEEHGEVLAALLAQPRELRDPFGEPNAVGEPGERVVVRRWSSSRSSTLECFSMRSNTLFSIAMLQRAGQGVDEIGVFLTELGHVHELVGDDDRPDDVAPRFEPRHQRAAIPVALQRPGAAALLIIDRNDPGAGRSRRHIAELDGRGREVGGRGSATRLPRCGCAGRPHR